MISGLLLVEKCIGEFLLNFSYKNGIKCNYVLEMSNAAFDKSDRSQTKSDIIVSKMAI